MPVYEYRLVSADPESAIAQMNELAAEGWEVQATHFSESRLDPTLARLSPDGAGMALTVILKRQKPPEKQEVIDIVDTLVNGR